VICSGELFWEKSAMECSLQSRGPNADDNRIKHPLQRTRLLPVSLSAVRVFKQMKVRGGVGNPSHCFGL
jgi:hypothetical protein